MPENSFDRRTLLRSLALTAGAAALLPVVQARSAEQPHLDVKDPAAVKLGYVEKAAAVDPKKFPSHEKGSSCENCSLLQGSAGAAYRPCSLFPGKLVATAGWCSGWTPEL
jgi:hypothetical protein